jgi:hypothetical protein
MEIAGVLEKTKRRNANMAVEREVIVERAPVTFEGMRVSWGGVWAGVLVVLGTLLLLTTLGMAIGFSADARNVEPEKIGSGAVIWARASLLIALFIGGMAATRMSMVWDRFTGLAQGALVWVVSLLVVLYLSASGVGLVVSSALINGTSQRIQGGPSAVAWSTFLSVVLSLLCALAGSAVGRRRAAARVAHEIE